MTPFRIRPATPEDVARIVAILDGAEAWLRSRGIPMWLADERRADHVRRDVEAGMFHLAEADGEIAGTLRFQLSDAEFWPDIDPSASAFVHRLAVSRDYAGTGASTALLSWAAERARALGREHLRLDCDAYRPRLRAFYERHGFRHHSDRQVGPFFVARYELPLT